MINVLYFSQQFHNINQQQTMRLGQQVLSKIENLLTHIEKKEQKLTTSKKTTKQNKDSTNFVKLHQDYKVKQQQNQYKAAERQAIQRLQCSPFKVTNKHSLFLNSQRPKSPIYQRVQQLQAERFEEMLRLREKYPPKASLKDEDIFNQAEVQEIQSFNNNQKKYSNKELQQKLKEYQIRERKRKQKLNMLKIKAIQEHSKDIRCKPCIDKSSDKLWKDYRLKKHLSSTVFQRFQQYELQRKTNLQKIEKKVKNQLTPFNPKISQNSRIIASRSSSKSNLYKNLDHSTSCKCFQRTRAAKLNTSTALHSSRKS